MKIRLVGAELFHADRQTDMTKLIVTFRNFVKEPKHMKIICLFHVINKVLTIIS